jgi:GDPmannose 4,6-dehydratase
MKRALITGITGQDGSYLAEFLLDKGYEVAGLMRRVSVPNTRNIEHLLGKVRLYDGDLLDQGSIERAIKDFKPSEVYNLAAQSFVKASWNQPILTGDVTALGPVRVLEAIRNYDTSIKFYQASSSEMYGNSNGGLLNETSEMRPHSPYAISKLYAHKMTQNYRESFGIFACSGILFNHESPRRGIEFVTRKIIYSVACIKLGVKNSKMSNEEKEPLVKDLKFKIGNMDSSRDWGYAKDYVEAMWMMLQQKTPEDYVAATGEAHSVKEFLQMAFAEAGISDWKKHVEVDERFKRPADLTFLQGDATKAKKQLGWKSKTSLQQLVKLMLAADLEYVKKYERN